MRSSLSDPASPSTLNSQGVTVSLMLAERVVCKFWLEPISLALNHGFPRWELNVIRSYIEDHLAGILEAWDEHCG
jgi:uncharacterized protein DUF4160